MGEYIYIPAGLPEIEIHYEIFPGGPAFDDTIEIKKFLINEKEVSLKLESHIMEYFDFENKLYNKLGH